MLKEWCISLLNKIKNNKYNILLVLLLSLVFIFSNHNVSKIEEKKEESYVKIFVQDTCIHCKELELFLTKNDIKRYNIEYINIASSTNLLIKLANKNNIPITSIGTPIIFTNYGYRIGFINDDNNKNDLINFLEQSLNSFKTEKKEKSNNFVNTIKAVFSSIFSLYSILLILGITSLVILISDEKKTNIIFCCILFSLPIISFLFLISWLDVYTMFICTRSINLLLSLILVYYVIKNFYSLIKENKNIFNNDKNLNKHVSTFIVLLSFLFNTINITRNSNISNVDSIAFFVIYSILVAILFVSILYSFHTILKNKKNYLIFNSVLFCVLFYIIFLLQY